MSDVLFLAREQGLLGSPWKVYLFGPERPAGGHRPYVIVDPSGGWEFGADGVRDDPAIYATSGRSEVCRATNSDVARVRYALIEALSR